MIQSAKRSTFRASVPCDVKNRQGVACPELVLVDMAGDVLTGYTAPCNHGQNPRRLVEEATRIHSERAPDPLRAETPAREAEPTTATDRTGAPDLRDCCGPTILEPSRCWCGSHELPTGHSILHCASEAGHAKDAALRSGRSA